MLPSDLTKSQFLSKGDHTERKPQSAHTQFHFAYTNPNVSARIESRRDDFSQIYKKQSRETASFPNVAYLCCPCSGTGTGTDPGVVVL